MKIAKGERAFFPCRSVSFFRSDISHRQRENERGQNAESELKEKNLGNGQTKIIVERAADLVTERGAEYRAGTEDGKHFDLLTFFGNVQAH